MTSYTVSTLVFVQRLFEGFGNAPKPLKPWASSFHIPTAEEIEEFPFLQAEDYEVATISMSIAATPVEVHLVFNGKRLMILVRSQYSAQLRYYATECSLSFAAGLLHELKVTPGFSSFKELSDELALDGLVNFGFINKTELSPSIT